MSKVPARGTRTVSGIRSGKDIKAMRCSGEIDITKPRFSEQPAALVPIILSNIKNFEPNAHNAIFERGLLEAGQKEQDLLNRLEQLPTLPAGRQRQLSAVRAPA